MLILLNAPDRTGTDSEGQEIDCIIRRIEPPLPLPLVFCFVSRSFYASQCGYVTIPVASFGPKEERATTGVVTTGHDDVIHLGPMKRRGVGGGRIIIVRLVLIVASVLFVSSLSLLFHTRPAHWKSRRRAARSRARWQTYACISLV